MRIAKPKIVVAAPMLALSLATGPAAAGQGGELDCSGAVCRVGVTVHEDGGTCRVSVQYESVAVRRGATVLWEIADRAYRFVREQDGIDIHGNPGARYFGGNGFEGGAWRYRWVSTPVKTPAPLNYDIHVRKINGPECTPLDPTIANVG